MFSEDMHFCIPKTSAFIPVTVLDMVFEHRPEIFAAAASEASSWLIPSSTLPPLIFISVVIFIFFPSNSAFSLGLLFLI